MTDEELIEELSEMGGHPCRAHLPMGETLRQAANRIEALTAENERLRGMLEMVLRESVDIECGERILYAGTVNDIRAALEKQP
jgi:hypothetical protein